MLKPSLLLLLAIPVLPAAPDHTYEDGPVLVQVRAQALAGERAGRLHMRVNTTPDVLPVALTVPLFTGDKDWEG